MPEAVVGSLFESRISGSGRQRRRRNRRWSQSRPDGMHARSMRGKRERVSIRWKQGKLIAAGRKSYLESDHGWLLPRSRMKTVEPPPALPRVKDQEHRYLHAECRKDGNS